MQLNFKIKLINRISQLQILVRFFVNRLYVANKSNKTLNYTKYILGSLLIFVLTSAFVTNVYALDYLDSPNIKYNIIPPDGDIMIGLVSTQKDFKIIQTKAANGTIIENVTQTTQPAFSIPTNVLGYINIHLTPSAHLPVSDDVLSTIWNERIDLQSLFPEVEHGHLYNLRAWAKNSGWNEDPRLSALIPEGKTPLYLPQKSDFRIIIGLVLSILIVIIIGFVVGYVLPRNRSQIS